MKLSPGDQIQIILTVGGVPYAKTRDLMLGILSEKETCKMVAGMAESLLNDIDSYGDEHEESRQEG